MRPAKAETQPRLAKDHGQDRAGDQYGSKNLRCLRRNQKAQAGDLVGIEISHQLARNQKQRDAQQDGETNEDAKVQKRGRAVLWIVRAIQRIFDFW
jgi:hypothetical protein